MILLESESKIVQEVLMGRLGEKYEKYMHVYLYNAPKYVHCNRAPRPVEPLEIRLCDFDGKLQPICREIHESSHAYDL